MRYPLIVAVLANSALCSASSATRCSRSTGGATVCHRPSKRIIEAFLERTGQILC